MAEVAHGIGVSPGIVIGPVHVIPENTGAARVAGSPGEEEEALDRAVSASVQQLHHIGANLRAEGHESEAGIMDAQALMAADPSLLDAVRSRLETGMPAHRAIVEATGEFKALFEAMDDPYFAARAADVQDVADRLLAALSSDSRAQDLEHPCIVVARDLSPSQTASMDRSLVLAFATDVGSPTSHSAILARALSIPAVVGMGDITQRVREGQEIALDGESGAIILDPDESDRRVLQQRAQRQKGRRTQFDALRDEPAQTGDGRRLTLAANIGSPADVPAALQAGAEGIGLFRTEFLFAGRDRMPDEDEQAEAYRSVLEAMPHHTVVIRTLDVGGDKPLPYLPSSREDNPFLGVRGLRYTLANPEVLRTQLRALLRASSAGKLAIMFPMVSEIEQIEAVKTLIDELRADVGGQAEVGVMIEIPAAALIARQIAHHVAFVSAGTNDLVQYTLAVDRVNETISSLYRPLHPAILRLLAETAAGAHEHGRWAGVCGEMGGDPLAIPLLVGLGFDELSMTASRIPEAKERIRSLSYTACRSLVERAIACETALQVEQLVREDMPFDTPA